MAFDKNDKNIKNWRGIKRGSMLEDHKQKISLAKKGTPSWNKGLLGYRAGEQHHYYGKHRSEETKEKIRIANKGTMPPNFRKSLQWLKGKAKIRDDYTCRICGLREKEIMEVDHIIPNAIKPELYEDLDNLQTLCPNCHRRKTVGDRRLIFERRKLT